MSTRRVDEDDDVDVEVELTSNDSNMGFEVLGVTVSYPASSTPPAQIATQNAMEVDPIGISTSSDTIQAREPSSAMDTTEPKPSEEDQMPPKTKTELDFGLETKYSKIWGDLKVRFTNRHFLKSATTYLQTLQTTTGTDGSDEVTVGSTTFYTSDTPILDMYLGMDNR